MAFGHFSIVDMRLKSTIPNCAGKGSDLYQYASRKIVNANDRLRVSRIGSFGRIRTSREVTAQHHNR